MLFVVCSFYRFMQPLWSNTPLLATNGNHEYELSTDGQTYAAYIARSAAPIVQLWGTCFVCRVSAWQLLLLPFDAADKPDKCFQF